LHSALHGLLLLGRRLAEDLLLLPHLLLAAFQEAVEIGIGKQVVGLLL